MQSLWFPLKVLVILGKRLIPVIFTSFPVLKIISCHVVFLFSRNQWALLSATDYTISIDRPTNTVDFDIFIVGISQTVANQTAMSGGHVFFFFLISPLSKVRLFYPSD